MRAVVLVITVAIIMVDSIRYRSIDTMIMITAINTVMISTAATSMVIERINVTGDVRLQWFCCVVSFPLGAVLSTASVL